MAGSQVRRRRFEFCRCHRMGPNPFLECPTCIGHPPTRNPFSLPSCFFFAREETRIFLSFFHVVSSKMRGRVSALDSLHEFISFTSSFSIILNFFKSLILWNVSLRAAVISPALPPKNSLFVFLYAFNHRGLNRDPGCAIGATWGAVYPSFFKFSRAASGKTPPR